MDDAMLRDAGHAGSLDLDAARGIVAAVAFGAALWALAALAALVVLWN